MWITNQSHSHTVSQFLHRRPPVSLWLISMLYTMMDISSVMGEPWPQSLSPFFSCAVYNVLPTAISLKRVSWSRHHPSTLQFSVVHTIPQWGQYRLGHFSWNSWDQSPRPKWRTKCAAMDFILMSFRQPPLWLRSGQSQINTGLWPCSTHRSVTP